MTFSKGYLREFFCVLTELVRNGLSRNRSVHPQGMARREQVDTYSNDDPVYWRLCVWKAKPFIWPQTITIGVKTIAVHLKLSGPSQRSFKQSLKQAILVARPGPWTQDTGRDFCYFWYMIDMVEITENNRWYFTSTPSLIRHLDIYRYLLNGWMRLHFADIWGLRTTISELN